jgi:beta-aspartyl-peptidase (threonine type)
MSGHFGIVIHGGAGAISKEKATPQIEKEIREMLSASVNKGHDILSKGGSAVDAVQAAVNVMEDSAHFNAGKGAVFTHDGKNEQDATIMDGRTKNCGGIAGVRHIKNPINLAREIMENSPHVLLMGDGAEQFAREHGIELADDDYFYTERRWQQLEDAKKKDTSVLSEGGHGKDLGTVGAVALDKNGNLAAATSSGGMTNKKHGRVGDSAIVGAGTYANDQVSISTTGHGEFFIRAVTAYDLASMMRYEKLTIADASSKAMEKLGQLGGTGGLIAIDNNGNIALPYNTLGMYRAHRIDTDEPLVQIWEY